MLGTVYREGAPFLQEKEKMGWNVQTVGIAPTATQTFVDLVWQRWYGPPEYLFESLSGLGPARSGGISHPDAEILPG